jgi:DNA-binding IscR family transcriptional regulator
MSRVLQVLANARVLRSEQGVTGGYLILTQLTKLSLFDLFEILCGPVAIARCLHANPVSTCSIQSTCNILSPIHSLNKKLEQFYRELSIADLLVTPGRMVNPDGKIKAMEIA